MTMNSTETIIEKETGAIRPMTRILPLAAVLALAACSPAQQAQVQHAASTPAGALFCAIHTVSGPIVVTLVNAEVAGVAPAAAPLAILATGMARSYVDAACAAAGGVPVAPPADPAAAPVVAVKV